MPLRLSFLVFMLGLYGPSILNMTYVSPFSEHGVRATLGSTMRSLAFFTPSAVRFVKTLELHINPSCRPIFPHPLSPRDTSHGAPPHTPESSELFLPPPAPHLLCLTSTALPPMGLSQISTTTARIRVAAAVSLYRWSQTPMHYSGGDASSRYVFITRLGHSYSLSTGIHSVIHTIRMASPSTNYFTNMSTTSSKEPTPSGPNSLGPSPSGDVFSHHVTTDASRGDARVAFALNIARSWEDAICIGR